MRMRILASAVGLALTAAACTTESAPDTTPAVTTQPETPTTVAPATTEAPDTEEPAMGPAALEAEDQATDGSSMVVAVATLPSPGFVAVHADANGAPGAVIGHSDLLPAGTSENVTVVFDEALAASATVWPMVHIDVNGNGEYEFEPPDNAIDLPGVLANGDIAVIPVSLEVQ